MSETIVNTAAVTLKPPQVQAEYGVPVSSLANLRWLRKGPRYIKLGRTILYRRVDIEAWINSQAVEPVAVAR